MTILRLCPKCGATLDRQVEGHRGPCRACERERGRVRRASDNRAVAVRDQRRWKQVARVARARDEHRCRQCGTTGKLEAYHVQPLAHGGAAYNLENIITLCASCDRKAERAA